MGRTFQNHKITRFESLHLLSVSQLTSLQLKHETAPCLGPVWPKHSTVQLYPDREGSNAAGSPSLHLLFHHFSPVPPPPRIHMTKHLELRLSCTGLPNCQTTDSAARCMQRLLKRIAELTLSWLTKHCSFKYGVVVITVASKQVGHGFDSTGCLGPFFVEFACSHWSRWLALALRRQ